MKSREQLICNGHIETNIMLCNSLWHFSTILLIYIQIGLIDSHMEGYHYGGGLEYSCGR